MLQFIEIGSFSLPTYGLCFLVGLAAAGLFLWKDPVEPLPPGIKLEDTIYSFYYALIGVFLGAKLLYLIVAAPDIYQVIRSGGFTLDYAISLLRGGLVFYGGLLGGLAGFVIYAKQYKMSALHLMDSIVFVVPLIHAFGRLGCFLAGCCYGVHSETFGVYFNHSDIAPHGERLLPTQLYESFFELAVFVLLLVISHRTNFAAKHGKGSLVFLYLPLYAIWRFGIEFLRADAERGIYFGLSTSQWISLILLIVSAVFWVRRRHSAAPGPDA
jgi:phosphatidylglycerol:prolipoprotein diacylglycerol transferase